MTSLRVSMYKKLLFSIALWYIIPVESHSKHHAHHDHHHHGTDDMHSHQDHHEHHHDHPHKIQPEQCSESASWKELFVSSSKREAFWFAVLSTVFIGCAPILCIKLVSTDDYYLKILLSFACGGLLGDVFLHLLPSALSIYQTHDESHGLTHDDGHHSHSHNEGHSLLGMHILIGFGIFFVLEKIFHETSSHSHANSKSDDSCHEDQARKHAITVLSVCADASHNFTDGLTIAASFLFSTKMGIIQTFSVLLHEIPHEIGDYAILIENGVSPKTAVCVQFLTAIGCLIGTLLGFILENTQIGTKWILPFTAGGFLYIACVQVLPTLVEKQYGVLQSTLHIIFFCFGISLMAFVGYIEEHAEDLLTRFNDEL